MIGLSILFQSLDFSAKRAAHQMISDGAMNAHYTIISMPVSVLQSEKHLFSFIDDDELFWQGNMYDVITKTLIDDSVTYCCLRDDGESMLVSNYLKYLDEKNTTNDQQPVRNVLKNFIQPFHLPPDEMKTSLTASMTYHAYNSPFSFPAFIEKISPPPNTV